MTDVKIWKVTDEFTQNGHDYKVGDEWAQPANWQYDEAYAESTEIGGRATFVNEYVQGVEFVQEGGRGPKVKKDIIGFRRTLIPVVEK